MSHRLVARVAETIRFHQLLPSGQEQIYLAISGGADSVALLMAFLALGYAEQVTLLHCNFSLRAEESDGDESFVRSLATTHDLPLYFQRFDTYAYAQSHGGMSIEMAARELRYGWFASLRQEAKSPTLIAVAHNADDQIETLLLNLSMGTGLRGLSGMPYLKREEGIIRPLLDVPRALILDYLQSLGQPFREDSSNEDVRYRRNFIRHRLLPTLEELNPSFRSVALRTIDNLRGVEALFLEHIERYRAELLGERGIEIAGILASPSPETLLFELLRPYGFSRDVVLEIASNLREGSAGARFFSPQYTLIRASQYLELRPRGEEQESFVATLDISTDGRVILPWGGMRSSCLASSSLSPSTPLLPLGDLSLTDEEASLSISPEHSLPPAEVSSELGVGEALLEWSVEPCPQPYQSLLPLPTNEAVFDYEALATTELHIRGRRAGDALYPYGMKGRKLLRRIFIDGKYTHREREAALVVCREDEILWLVGRLADRRYCLTPRTKTLLRLRLVLPVSPLQ